MAIENIAKAMVADWEGGAGGAGLQRTDLMSSIN